MTSRWLTAFGITIAIDADDPRIFPFLDEQLPAFPNDDRSRKPVLRYRVAHVPPRGRVAVVRGRRTVATSNELWGASVRLVADLQAALARAAAGWTFVHAGVVEIRGRALLLPARSGAGKSTLVAALLRAGATYGSDELAVFDRDGHVHPYSRPIVLRVGERSIARVGPETFGSRAFDRRIRPGAVLFTEFQSSGRLDVRAMSTGQVVIRLLEHCLGARGRPTETLRILGAVAGQARGFASVRGDADAAAHALVDGIDGLW